MGAPSALSTGMALGGSVSALGLCKKVVGRKGSTVGRTGTRPHAEGLRQSAGSPGCRAQGSGNSRYGREEDSLLPMLWLGFRPLRTGTRKVLRSPLVSSCPKQTSDSEGPVGSEARRRGLQVNSAGDSQAGPAPARPKSHEGRYTRPSATWLSKSWQLLTGRVSP